MAATKKSTGRTSAAKKPVSKRTSKAEEEKKAAADKVLWSTVLFAAGVLTAAFAAVKGESAWLMVHNVLLGLFGVGVVLVPPILLYASVMIASDKGRVTVTGKAAQGLILILIICAFIQIFFAEPPEENITLGKQITDLYENGKDFSGGGFMSAVLGLPLINLFGRTGAGVIIVLLGFVFAMLLANKTVIDVFRYIKNIFAAARESVPEYEEAEDFTPPPGAKRAEAAARAKEKAELKADKAAQKFAAKAEKAAKIAAKKVPNGDVPEDVAKKKQEEFDIDIPVPGGLDPDSGKKAVSENADKPVNAEQAKEEKRSPAQIEADNIARQIEANEAERKAARQDPKKAEEQKRKEDLASIIKKAAAGNGAASANSENADHADLPWEDDTPDESPENITPAKTPAMTLPPLPSPPKKGTFKGSTLASNKITDDADLDMPETTAKDIQNEIAENIPAPIEYVIPPLELLKKSANEVNAEQAEEEMTQNADTLVETLKSFGVMTRIVDIHRGPTVTRYELQPNAGVKISKITGLSDDIALNLAAEGVRIQAPIPGKAAVGIEVPNKIKDIVTLRDVLDTEEFRNAQSKLTFAVGKNIDGEIILGDIAKLPHIIIAGTTGSGKSVCTNGIIMSILYNATPDEVRLVLIDPKVVEFKIYDGIPHLLIPVVTDPRKAAGALSWAVQEMLKRYKLFADNNVRDLKGYNEMAAENEGFEPLPRIVIVIDELADLMMAAAGEVEDSICRLAQMARAAGMHLIIATQRPTVDVITGLIKANIPSRIALKVASGIDSRSIINEVGAEKLLGNGDLLYFPTGYAKPVRVQNCFSSDKEVAAVVNFIKNGAGDVVYSDDIMKEIESNIPQPKGEKDKERDKPMEGAKNSDSLSDEDLAEMAVECAVEAGTSGVSVSYLQRKLKLGYARAARIMDMLDEMGVVGPFEGAKPRQVLMTREMFLQRKLAREGITGGGSGEE
ncbi:MAG: DNA translocase FtsK [Ruminococcus sp.]|nr:DNA translocase FtsK [Ruminococcus sp.]